MNPGHGLVEADRTAGLGARNLWRPNGIVGGDSVQVAGQGAEGDVQIAGGGAFAAPSCIERGDGFAVFGCIGAFPLVR